MAVNPSGMLKKREGKKIMNQIARKRNRYVYSAMENLKGSPSEGFPFS